MAMYTAYAEYTTMLSIEIEADSLEQAYELACAKDGGDWRQVDIDGWTVTDVMEANNANN